MTRKCVRFEVQYDDGKIHRFTGLAAERHHEAVNAGLDLATVHGWRPSFAPTCEVVDAPAPEAKPAESEVLWLARYDGEALADAVHYSPRFGSAAEARKLAHNMGTARPCAAVRVRITVEPAPVEPEETHR